MITSEEIDSKMLIQALPQRVEYGMRKKFHLSAESTVIVINDQQASVFDYTPAGQTLPDAYSYISRALWNNYD